MYYVPVGDMVLLKPGADVFASHHVFVEPGTYCAGEITAEGNADAWTVYARGNPLPYTHPECWLTSDCVVPGPPGHVVAFKVIQRIETLFVFKGKVMPMAIRDVTFQMPFPPKHERVTPALELHLIVEATGVTIDAKLYHVLAMKARTWCFTHDVPVPENLAAVLTRVINQVADMSYKAYQCLDSTMIKEHNVLLDLKLPPPPPEVPRWRRWLTAPIRVVGNVVEQCAYTKALGLPSLHALMRRTTASMRHGLLTAIRGYAYGAEKDITWHKNPNALTDLGTCIPDRSWENELVSIFTRAMPPPIDCKVDPKIVHSAQQLARLIGPITQPIDLEVWLSRYPEARRKQLREALDKPYTATVDFFHKIEQLDEEKDPRAIQARRDEYKVRIGPWVAAFEERCKQTLPFLVKTLDEDERALAIAALRERGRYIVEVDFSRFDRHNHRALMEMTEHLIYDQTLPKHVANALHQQLRSVCKTRTGLTYEVEGTRMSGDVNTSIGNCIIVACLCMGMGIPADAMKIEGDDMIAACTQSEVENLHPEVIEATGHKPKLKILPEGQGSFCSRYDVVDSRGEPRRVRHPLRDLRRFGFTLHRENSDDAILRHLREWEGVPMLGPVYRKIAEQRNLAIGDRYPEPTVRSRAEFYLQFGINAETQREFETRPEARPGIIQGLAEAEEGDAPSWHRGGAAQGVTRPSARGDNDVHLQTRLDRDGEPGCKGLDVRDVPAQGTGARQLPVIGRQHVSRPVAHGRGLRPKGCSVDLPSHGGVIAQGNVPSVARNKPIDPTRASHEADVALHRQRVGSRVGDTGAGPPVRSPPRNRSVRPAGLQYLQGRESRHTVGGVQHRILLTPPAIEGGQRSCDHAAKRAGTQQRHHHLQHDASNTDRQSTVSGERTTVPSILGPTERNQAEAVASARCNIPGNEEVCVNGVGGQHQLPAPRKPRRRRVRPVARDTQR